MLTCPSEGPWDTFGIRANKYCLPITDIRLLVSHPQLLPETLSATAGMGIQCHTEHS